MFPGDDFVQKAPLKAVFKTRCARCKTWIQVGAVIKRDDVLKRFVHGSCAHAQRQVVAARAQVTSVRNDSAMSPTLPHGLKVKTLKDYQVEWSRYLQFAQARQALVPGRDVQWDMQLLWDYFKQRSTTCKPTTIVQIVTKLRHFGMMHGFVLANSKFDARPAEYGMVRNMKRQVALDARSDARQKGIQHADVERCTPISKRGIDLLLSAFQVSGRNAFAALFRADCHHLVASVMQHTGGMRYGQFVERDYAVDSFIRDSKDDSLRLVTDYSRYAGKRQFCIEFEAFPRFASMWYHVRSNTGALLSTFSAANLMTWHFELLQQHGQRHVFRPVLGEGVPSRLARQDWLRQTLLLALPLHAREARGGVDR